MNGLVIGITGSRGFLGRPLSERLARAGHTVVPLPRIPGALPALDAVIHLGGESVAGLWTARRKRSILESRVEGTRRRMAAADKFCAKYGTATECGFGRREADTVPSLLDLAGLLGLAMVARRR